MRYKMLVPISKQARLRKRLIDSAISKVTWVSEAPSGDGVLFLGRFDMLKLQTISFRIIKMKYFFVVMGVLFISACGTANNYLADKTKTVEYYRIFDIKTKASKQNVTQAVSDGIGRNVNNTQETTPIPRSATPPDTPGRFALVNPLEGSKMAGLATLAGGAGSLGFQVVTCDGAVWTAKAERKVTGSDRLNLTLCLFPYQEGYHLDMYAVFVKKEGGVFQVSRNIAGAMVGTPEQWTEKTFLDVVRYINATVDAKITLLEAQPEIRGTPWLDHLDAPVRK